MAEYEDIFEMLEALRTHKLKKGECLISTASVKGTSVGFSTADGSDPAVRWDITVKDLKRSCDARTSEEAREVHRRMRFHHDRLKLAEDLRSGLFSLEEKPAPEPPTVVVEEDPVSEMEEFLQELGQ